LFFGKAGRYLPLRFCVKSQDKIYIFYLYV
jgi:hypothetical protein